MSLPPGEKERCISYLPVLPASLRVELDFYDAEQKKLLLQYPTSNRLNELMGTTVEIPASVFAANFLFHESQAGLPSSASSTGFEEDLLRTAFALAKFVSFENSGIHSTVESASLPTHISEYVGEAIGLFVVNQLHDMTLADWSKIKQIKGMSNVKIFDFAGSLGADGKYFVELEAKGTCVETNSKKEGNVYNQKCEIVSKKIVNRTTQKLLPSSRGEVLRYGTITAIARQPGSVLKCWLVDPPGDEIDGEARVMKLLNRMRFMSRWITFILPRSLFATALAVRVADMEKVSSPFELSESLLNVGTLEPQYEQLEFEFLGSESQHRKSLLKNKSRVSDGTGGGKLLPLGDHHLLFIGISEELMFLAASQDFERVLNYRARPHTVNKSIDCVMTQKQASGLRLLDSVAPAELKKVRFSLPGQIHYTSEGLIFSFLALAHLQKQR